MKLADFIEDHFDAILADWDAFARTCLPAAQNMSSEQLRNGAEVILRSISEDIRQPQTDLQQRQKARGWKPLNSPRLTRAAHQHASDRFSNGFTLDQLISEYRVVRASIFEIWRDEQTKGVSFNTDEINRFNEAMDQILIESVSWFSARLDRSRDLFLGVLSHDLRDPLGAITLSVEVVIADTKLAERHRAILAQIPRSAARMGELIRNLLDFTQARLGNGIAIMTRPSDMGEIAHHVVAELSARNPDRRIELVVHGDPKGTWDPERLQQVISNLLSNAIIHGDHEHAVTVKVRGDTDEVTVTVHNHGEPMSEESKVAAMEPLSLGPTLNGGVHKSQRVRLGLFIARHIIDSHSGTTAVKSRAESGTEVTIRLPRHVG